MVAAIQLPNFVSARREYSGYAEVFYFAVAGGTGHAKGRSSFGHVAVVVLETADDGIAFQRLDLAQFAAGEGTTLWREFVELDDAGALAGDRFGGVGRRCPATALASLARPEPFSPSSTAHSRSRQHCSTCWQLRRQAQRTKRPLVTTLVDGAGPPADATARAQLERELARTDDEHDQDNLKLRIARLSGSVAVVHVGAATDV